MDENAATISTHPFSTWLLTDLDTGLAEVDRNAFSHVCEENKEGFKKATTGFGEISYDGSAFTFDTRHDRLVVCSQTFHFLSVIRFYSRFLSLHTYFCMYL